jgi:hypothetical protein
MNNTEKFIQRLNSQLNILDVSGSSSRHPKCRGYRTQDIGGSEYECGYETTIDCDECKYGGGLKNPEAKCNQNCR